MTTRLLLIAHAPLASALRSCALHVFPDCADEVLALDVLADAPPQDTLAQAQQLLLRHGAAEVLVLTDTLGATPSNVAQRLIDGQRSLLLAGVNLPMLLRALGYRHEPVTQLLVRAQEGAVRGIVPVATVSAEVTGQPIDTPS